MEKTLEIHIEELREKIAKDIEKSAKTFLKDYENKEAIATYRLVEEAFRICAAIARDEE